MSGKLIFIWLGFCIVEVVLGGLYPFGGDSGDTKVTAGDSEKAKVKFPIHFMQNSYKKVYIHTDGVITFGSKINIKNGLIAPFYTNLDNSEGGKIWYRHSQDEADFDKISAELHYLGSRKSTEILIITWDNVPLVTPHGLSEGISFQVVIVTDKESKETYVQFFYPSNDFPDPDTVEAPSIGFAFSGSKFLDYAVAVDDTQQAFDMASSSNVGINGMWVFQIDGRVIDDIIPGFPTDINIQGDENRDVDFNVDIGNDCSLCDRSYASCVDYSGGSCCVCNSDYIGNGKTCLSNATNHRPNGYVSGTLNGQVLSRMNLHSYIVTREGRTYTAISPSPQGLNYTMQLLLPIAETVSWLFAVPKNKGINGFSSTGGKFRHRARMTFDTGDEMIIDQEYETNGDMTGNIKIDGTLPYLPKGTKIVVDPHTVNFDRRRPGFIHSYAERSVTITNTGQQINFNVDQTYDFEECRADDGDFDIELYQMSQNFMTVYAFHEPGDDILRYAMISNISPTTDEVFDPCDNNNCDANAECLPQGTSYECRCGSGFEGDGYRCRERDPCSRNNCDSNADCVRDGSGFDCYCRSGYEGDGYRCRLIIMDPCLENDCDRNARCVARDTVYDCECELGYYGDGYTCNPEPTEGSTVVEESSFDLCNNQCDVNAQCIEHGFVANCECNEGYTGDGYSCEEEIAESYSSSFGKCDVACDVNAECIEGACQCNEGYEGDGTVCNEESGEIGSEIDESVVDTRCDFNDCNENARCVPSGRSYYCTCNDGFEGNGYDCSRPNPCDDNPCDVNAECLQYGESFRCRCLRGYDGDGRSCRYNPCYNNPCDVNAKCTPMAGNRAMCSCNDGYEGDGYRCETERVVVCSRCDTNALCVPDGRSFRCECNTGYVGNGQQCRDLDECRETSSACDPNADCFNNVGSFSCRCQPGFAGDGKTCRERPSVGDGMLVFGQGMSVMKQPINDNAPGGRVIMKKRQTVVGLGYDCVDGYIYWTDVAKKSINRVKPDGSDYKRVVKKGLSSPEGVAIDPWARNMYWTDSGFDRIEVSKLDGTDRRILISDDLVNPRAIMADAIEGYLYWTDWNREAPKIERSYMDGTNREVLVDTGLRLPNGLTIDQLSNKLCWADAGSAKVECIGLDGDQLTRSTVFSQADYPFALASFDQNLYWTDWTSNKILSINHNGGLSADTMELPLGGAGMVHGITAASKCSAGYNACSNDNGGCSNLCLPTPGRQRTCACPTDTRGNELGCN